MSVRSHAKLSWLCQILVLVGYWLIALVLGIGLLTLVYMLPVDPIRNSVANSVSVFEREGVYPIVWPATLPEHSSTRLDNFTDMLLLNEAACDGEAPVLENAMRAPRVGGDALEGLKKASLGDKPDTFYPRYWHGSLVVLKPMLFLGLDYHVIRMINTLILITLTILLLIKISKVISWGVAAAFFAGFVAMGFWAIGLSLQYSPTFYVMIATLLIMIKYDSIISNISIVIGIMFCTGMATAYFDLLTFPLITFGIPMTLYMLQNKSKSSNKYSIFRICVCGLAWFAGYSLLWASKWVVASLILHENVIVSASEAMKTRISANTSEISNVSINTIDYIKLMTKHLFNPLTMAAIFASISASVALLAEHLISKPILIKNTIYKGLPFCLIALTPLIWFLVLKNHSFQHNIFTYKILAVTVVAILSWLANIANQMAHSFNESQG